MRLGLFTLATDESMPFGALAREAEEQGFDILFTGEHAHIPVGAQVWSGGPLPPHYRHILDPFLALAGAAAATTTIRLGTAVCLVALHEPIRLAKAVSTLDFLSEGRFVFGSGYGYLDREIRNHGVDPAHRKAMFRDKMLAMQRIWISDVASYDGPYVSFADVEQYPKPVNGKRPPTLLGAKLRADTIKHMVEFCDGWIPSAMMAGDSLADDITTLRAALLDAGRDPAAFEIVVFHTARAGADRRADDWGAPPIVPELIETYEKAGVDTLCLPLPSNDDARSGLVKYGNDLRAWLAS
jgi:probable F420-dependent oxidoreductase